MSSEGDIVRKFGGEEWGAVRNLTLLARFFPSDGSNTLSCPLSISSS